MDQHHDHDHGGEHSHATPDHAGHDDSHDDRHNDGHHHGGHHDHHHHHTHGVTDQRRIGWAFLIIVTFMVVEVAGGLWSGSLALLADAGHMVSDSAALGFSWLAILIGRRPATAQLSYGYKRLEILAAFANGCALFFIAAWIVLEAVHRFAAPVPVIGRPMLIIAFVGLLANIAAFIALHGGNRQNLNLRGAWLHVLGDLLGSVAAIVAALVILGTGWTPIDPILSIVVAVIILKSAWGIVKSSAHILLEGAPENMSLAGIQADLQAHVPEIDNAHHIHVWSITGEQHLITLHVRAAEGAAPQAAVAAVQRRLAERFGIQHATIQVEDGACCDSAPCGIQEEADEIRCA